MKLRVISLAIASLMATSVWADSMKDWGYWDASGRAGEVPATGFSAPRGGSSGMGVSGNDGKRNDRGAVVNIGNLPNTVIQDIALKTPPAAPAIPVIPTPIPREQPGILPADKWFGFAALESGTPVGAYDDNAYLLVGSDWVYGTVPGKDGKTMTFRIAGEDMVSKTTMSNSTGYAGWDWNKADPTDGVQSYVHVNMQIPMPDDVPMTIGHWHKGSQTYYTVVGSTTQFADLQALAAGPVLSYTGQSMGGSNVSMSVNFANSTWNGTWTANPSAAVMSGSARNTPSFTANGTITGSSIQSTAINGVANLDAANSFVKGKFYGTGAAAVGGLTVIKTDAAQTSDLFVACKTGVTCNSRGMAF